MVSLLDVGPLTDTVKVRGKDVTTYPITPAGLFYLIRQSEEIRLLLDGRASEIQPDRLMTMGPDNIALVVGIGAVNVSEFEHSEGTGIYAGLKFDHEKWEIAVRDSARVAKTLSATEQLSAIVSIFKMTFPEGVGPFVDALRALTEGLDAAVKEGAESASENRSLNGGSAQVITDITQIQPGIATPRVN